ncbi:MAG: four helix bundle protein [Parcubacteria group bacterium CG10_big_fil_rev_8_21_14_0_10_36_14]|nr:MAG: four helix bundle protein [Parcubacteria group bacterium CG10_big_fil_rev_8_21_14_0_10_36_14]
MAENKLKSFTDLNAWKEAHKLVLMIYKIIKDFPKEEISGLTNQIRRAVISITSNIAEEFSRNSCKERIQFYAISLGSLSESQNQLLTVRNVGYISNDKFKIIAEQNILTIKLLNGLIRSARNFS